MFPFRQSVVILLMVTNVILLSVVVYKTSQLYTEPHSTIFSNSEICYDDYGERIRSIMLKQLDENYQRDIKNDDHLQRVRKVAAVVNEDKSQQKPAAHLQMDPDARYNKDKLISTLRWKSDGKRSFVKDGLTVVEEGIRVEKEGNYFIYSNVVFYGKQTKELDFARLCHYLYKRVPTTRRSKVQQLSSNPQSTCKIRRGKPAFAPSYIGAVYHLEAGATVMVKTSSVDRLVKQPQSTYLGIYMI
ncbi:lymphotoxin-alpha-like isoform X2 [Gigantopelta aegis]|uniref:lymphotoxin-alpha-like isoform X2 n=1 Tax=Gigantopelta aegis TaxID=1735272 RepID=UPI001B88D873|nr:lymphotoxin-alpha-like isoform X2 [Gigantopelta aegis]